MELRLESCLWIAAEIRRCAADDIVAVVARRGDPDAGAILLKVNRFAAGCTVYSGSYGLEGARVWIAGTGAVPVSEADADAYIERQRDRDPDLWVLEIEDPRGRFGLAETVA